MNATRVGVGDVKEELVFVVNLVNEEGDFVLERDERLRSVEGRSTAEEETKFEMGMREGCDLFVRNF